MAFKRGHEIAAIDVELITLVTTPPNGGTPIELGLKTATQIDLDPQIETTDAIKLIIKGLLRAQKRERSTLTGNTITVHDNVFNPQLMQIIQGGEITYDEDGEFLSYAPPIVGEDYSPVPFKLCIYTAVYDEAGIVSHYMRYDYPNCTGVPVAMSVQDDVFVAPEYTIISAPGSGERAYVMTKVQTLPELISASWINAAA